MNARRFCGWSVLLTLVMGMLVRVSAAPPDIVLYASDATVHGIWSKTSAGGAAGGQLLSTVDNGWSTTNAPLASPNDWFEATFTAPANTPYHVWLRLRATADSKYNDSVWAQFSDATDLNGTAVYQIGSGSGLLINLENCFACGVAGWGWQDKAYWLNQASTIAFSTGGSHTIRVQIREDGVQVDQIVLSPSTYLSSVPGQVMNDATIVAKPAATSTPASTPFSGTAAAIPGTIQAQDFDNGGEGVAYHDLTAGNIGGAYRQTDVDLEPSADGGNDLGWIAVGEWVNYTVNVGAAGSYWVTFRVASSGQGGSFHLEMNGTNVSGAMTVPNTGGWQSWQSITKTVTLAAGQQVARLVMDTAGAAGGIGNINSMAFATAATVSAAATPFTGTSAAIPGTIAAANFDNGGEGVAYHDTTAGNAGGAYRSTDVDLQPSADGGYNIGWIAAGEWVTYTVNVASAGNYTAQLRVASPGGGASLRLRFSANNVSAVVSVPATGGWQAWTTVSVPVTLTAGQQAMTLLFDTSGLNVTSITLTNTVVPPPPPPPPPTSSSFRMMTWNIHHGYTTGDVYNLYTQVQFIVAQNPDVIALEEVQTWDENQPPKLKSLLEQLTGQTWTLVWAPVINTDGGTEGNVILTRLPVVASTYQQLHATSDWTVLLANRSVAQATVLVNSVPINVFATHLDYATPSYRTVQEQQLMPWLWNFAGPRLVGGDFNSWWGEYWITTMETQHTDTWHDVTGLQDLGYTVNQAVRFDYVFRAMDNNWRVTPTNIFVPVTSISDHNPVVADFTVQ